MPNVIVSGRIGLFDMRRAVFSTDEKYRYLLESVWEPKLGILTWVLLNPSKADHTMTDPTNVRARGFAEAWGFGGLRFVNLFAFRAVDPKDMLAADDPTGPGNDEAILDACCETRRVMVGWGTHGNHLGRDRIVTGLLQKAGMEMYALKINKNGSPAHPLYMPYGPEPIPWRM